ncbi:unnamed protein product, partial [Effrenium voratum]
RGKRQPGPQVRRPRSLRQLAAHTAGSASWPNDATHGRHNRAWLRFWVWSFLTSKTYAGDDPRRSWILWLSASFYQFIMASAVVFLLVLDSTTDVTVTTDEYWIAELVLTCVWSVEYFLRLWSCVEACALPPNLWSDLSIDSNELRGLGALRMLRVFTLLRLERLAEVSQRSRAEVLQSSGALRRQSHRTDVLRRYCLCPKSHCANDMTYGSARVGYGDLYPESPLGRVVASITAFLGIGLFALPAGIITSGFRDEQERKYHRQWQHVANILSRTPVA